MTRLCLQQCLLVATLFAVTVAACDRGTDPSQGEGVAAGAEALPGPVQAVQRPSSRDGSSDDDDEAADDADVAPGRLVTETGAFKLQKVQIGGCSALLPEGWPSPVLNQTSTTFDAFSPDRSMYAGYGHQAVNTQLAPYAWSYPPPLSDPALYSGDPAEVALAYARIIEMQLGGSGALAYTAATDETIGDYRLLSIASDTHRGLVFFHRRGFPGDGVNYSYSLPMYFALARSARWQSSGWSLARLAASIDCRAQFVPRSTGPEIGGSSSSTRSRSGEDDSSGAGYNPQLGTEVVHDPTTGENYLVDPSRDWSETGPNGPGYYAPRGGGDYVQLQPGRVD